MASPIGSLNTLNDPELVETWIRCFAALARVKKLKDRKETGGDNEIMDLFLATAGCEAVKKIATMAYPTELEELTFEEIVKIINKNIRPKKKLVIAERTKFMETRQDPNESIIQYVHRLKVASKYCEFEKLGSEDMTTEDELILLRLIEGLYDKSHKHKIMERLQISNLNLEASIEFAQQLELIEEFNQPKGYKETYSTTKDRIKCRYCDKEHERDKNKCPALGKTCFKCKKRDHFQVVCRYKREIECIESNDSPTEKAEVFEINTRIKTKDTIKLNGISLPMQVDTGSEVTLIPKNFWERIGKPKLKKTSLKLKQFDGTIINVMGTFEGTFETKKRFEIIPVTVVACYKNHGLLGIDVLKVDTTKLINSIKAKRNNIGLFRGYKASIRLKENHHPTYFESRRLPVHILPAVVAKLKKMIEQGILEKAPQGGSNWASPIVAIKKTDGDLRICGDYKIGVNHQICSDSFPLPNIETASHELAGMKYFAKIDLKAAYNQIEIDDNFKEVTTINTPIGLLRWTRLPFGVKTSSHIFQRTIEGILLGKIKNMVIYQDDICVGASTKEELKYKVVQILKKLSEVGMTINEDKCELMCEKISYLGYQISKDGISPDDRLTKKIAEISTPTNKKELESFLGLTNFYSKYIPRYSDIIQPFAKLRKKNVDFNWTQKQSLAFESLKKALTRKPVIKIFDPKKEITLTTDASAHAMAAILSQEGHPIMYLSRKLTQAETNYSNIEKEALAIIWSTERAHDFLMGRKFLLRTDHRPLEFIFNPRKELPKVTSSRIIRWAIKLMAFDFDIIYVKGNTIPHVDALSRLEFNGETAGNPENNEDKIMHWVETDVLPLKRLRMETKQDPVLNRITDRIRKNVWSNCSISERPYKETRHKLTIENGIICSGDTVVPPETLRKDIIQSVHDDIHCGITATQRRLRLQAWWPGYSKEVENYVKRCPKCAEIKNFKQTKIHSWPRQEEPWVRVHMDHAYIKDIGLFLVLVDAFSGWPEVIKVKDRKADTVKQVLRTIFSRNGVPKTIVTDNAPEFCDDTLCLWLKQVGCVPYKTPPYHPQSNGIAERMVQTVKMGLKAFSSFQENIEAYLPRLLLSYRSIPHAGRKQSPSELMGRQIRAPITMSFSTKESVWYKKHKGSDPERAKFLFQKGHNTAILEKNGQHLLAHADQFRTSMEPDDIEMKGEEEDNKEETQERDSETEQSMDISDQEPQETDEESEIRPRSPINRNKEKRYRIVRRSARATQGIRPLRFREM